MKFFDRNVTIVGSKRIMFCHWVFFICYFITSILLAPALVPLEDGYLSCNTPNIYLKTCIKYDFQHYQLSIFCNKISNYLYMFFLFWRDRMHAWFIKTFFFPFVRFNMKVENGVVLCKYWKARKLTLLAYELTKLIEIMAYLSS